MMVERRDGDRDATYIPPMPENTKPKASRDNAVEMAAGGMHEREALDAQREKAMDPGRTDNPHGTGVGYAGEGSVAYGSQEEHMSGETTKRTSDPESAKGGSTRPQPEQQQHQQSGGQKQGGGQSGQGSQQSTGSVPPTQGTGSTPQSHAARPSTSESGAPPTTTGSTSAGSMTGATTANRSAGSGMQTPGTGGSQGQTSTAQSQATEDGENTAQDKPADVKDQAQQKLTEVKSQAQDTLEGVKANMQTKTDQLKESVTGKTDQLRETVTGKTDQLIGTVGEKGEQAKQVANEKSTQAGEKLTGIAGTLRDRTQAMGSDSPVATVATKAAGALEQTGSYLQESTPDAWVGDLKQLISRKPIESVIVAAGLGYMAARAFRK
jgi:ElaB/YqjD/DUF883 family membrane-anchored ribosome-binding protein